MICSRHDEHPIAQARELDGALDFTSIAVPLLRSEGLVDVEAGADVDARFVGEDHRRP